MLANGTTLSMKTKSGTDYELLKGLKEVPEIGIDREKVDNTTLGDKAKIYEFGIGDPGDLTYKFRWENAGTDSTYRKLRTVADSGEVVSIKETLPDGTEFTFDAQCSVKVGGGGINAAIDFTLSLGLQSDDIKVTDPKN